MQTRPPPTPPAPDSPRVAALGWELGGVGLSVSRSRPGPPAPRQTGPPTPSPARPLAAPASTRAGWQVGEARDHRRAEKPESSGSGGGKGGRRGPGRRRGRGFLCLQPAAPDPAPSPPRATLGAGVGRGDLARAGGARPGCGCGRGRRTQPGSDPQVRAGPSVVAAPGPASPAQPGGERGWRALRTRAPSSSAEPGIPRFLPAASPSYPVQCAPSPRSFIPQTPGRGSQRQSGG